MGASKKLALANEEKAAVAGMRHDRLNGLYAIGGSIANICTDGLSGLEHEEIAEKLMVLLNEVEATNPPREFIEVVKGAMRAMGFEPAGRSIRK